MLATVRASSFDSVSSPPLPSSPESAASTSASSNDSETRTPPNSVLSLSSSGKATLAASTYAALGTTFASHSISPTQSISSTVRAGTPSNPSPPPPTSRHESAFASPPSPLVLQDYSNTSLLQASNPQPFFSQPNSFAHSPTTFQFPTIKSPPPPRSPTVSFAPRAPSPTASSDTPPSKRPPARDRRQSLQVQPLSVLAARTSEQTRDRRQSTPLLGPSMMTGDALPRPRKKVSPQHGSAFGAKTSAVQSGADGANELEAKVVILGAQGVGKTAIVHRITSGMFSRSLASTLGASFLTKRLVVDGCKIRLQLWDTAGQERFRSMAPLYYRGALAAILVYDITNLDSFYDVKMWLQELRRDMSPDLIIHVVGCKLDLALDQRAVELDFAQRTVAEWELEFSPAQVTPPPRDSSPPSPPRPRLRTNSTRRVAPSSSVIVTPGGSGSGTGLPHSASMPVIPTSLGARVRKMSTKLVVPPPLVVTSCSSAASSTDRFDSGSSSGLASSVAPDGPSRSGSRLSLSLGGLGLNSSRGRKSFEEDRRHQDELERERVQEMIDDCVVKVTEASAAVDVGVDEVFLTVSQRLVERKSQIEHDRILRSRDSIILTNSEPPVTSSSWCC